MTIQEAIEELKKDHNEIDELITAQALAIVELRKANMLWGDDFDGWYERYTSNMNALNEYCSKKQKYRWHDLRKNPEDLPILYEKVLVYSDFKYSVASSGRAGWYNGDCYISTPVMWRYIEPFEEGDTE